MAKWVKEIANHYYNCISSLKIIQKKTKWQYEIKRLKWKVIKISTYATEFLRFFPSVTFEKTNKLQEFFILMLNNNEIYLLNYLIWF